MENQIRKSLTDKSTVSLSHMPRIIANNYGKNIKEQVINGLGKSDQIDVAVSYVVWSGLSLLINDLKRFDNNSRMIVTTEGFVTDPYSLKRLLGLNMTVKVYAPGLNDIGFHMKSYMFHKKDTRSLIIGSSNISARAFGRVHDMAVGIDSLKDGKIIEEYEMSFNRLWEDVTTVEMTEEFIDEYEKLFIEKRKLEKVEHEERIKKFSIQPNFMQYNALEAIERYRNDGYNKGLVIAATGTGKTYLSAFDIERLKTKKMLFLVHSRIILKSAIKTFEKIFPLKKMMELNSSNAKEINNFDFVFTTDKTAYNILYDKIDSKYFQYIVFDEAHKIGEGTLYEKLMEYFHPEFMLGITATPERTDQPDYLFKQFDYSVPYEIRLIDALEHQLVCPFSYYGIDASQERLIQSKGYNYNELIPYMIEKINKIGHYGSKLRGLIFCKDIAECKKVSNLLNDNNIKSDYAVSGEKKSSPEDVIKKIESLESDELDSVNILCTVNKFNEGVDIPEVNIIIMLRNTESSIIFLQQLGRGLRLTSDPDKFVTVLDFIGNSNKNYTIAEALTGRKTANKEILMKMALNKFNDTSNYINVNIEEAALDKIISNIAFEYKALTQIKSKYKSELSRYELIPDLVELYNNEVFNELELLQLLCGNFYEPFEEYYKQKYDIVTDNKFLKKFLDVITQFVFRGYSNKHLGNYLKILSGEVVQDDFLMKILLPYDTDGGRKTSISGEYNKYYSDSRIFEVDNGIKLTSDIIIKLKNENALELFNEHIVLFKEIFNMNRNTDTGMKAFDLVTKAEFLLNTQSQDIYLNAVGEKIDKTSKVMYSPITITSGKNAYENHIESDSKIAYYTQGDTKRENAEEKIKMIVEEGYTFEIAARFPHIKYESTSYFYMGKISISEISDTLTYKNAKDQTRYNHKIIFELESKIPQHLMIYRK